MMWVSQVRNVKSGQKFIAYYDLPKFRRVFAMIKIKENPENYT